MKLHESGLTTPPSWQDSFFSGPHGMRHIHTHRPKSVAACGGVATRGLMPGIRIHQIYAVGSNAVRGLFALAGITVLSS